MLRIIGGRAETACWSAGINGSLPIPRQKSRVHTTDCSEKTRVSDVNS